jgi:DUF971 family protein
MIEPIELRLCDAGTALEIDWSDHRPSRLSARRLRDACRCAECTRAKVDGRALPRDNEIAVSAIDPVGSYAVNLRFSDGHARGIFPWAYLREITAEAEDAISCSTGVGQPGSVPAEPSRKDDA